MLYAAIFVSRTYKPHAVDDHLVTACRRGFMGELRGTRHKLYVRPWMPTLEHPTCNWPWEKHGFLDPRADARRFSRPLFSGFPSVCVRVCVRVCVVCGVCVCVSQCVYVCA